MKINGVEGMSRDQVTFEVQRGGRFVLYSYCVSLLVVTFKRPSAIYFIRSGESAIGRGMPLDFTNNSSWLVGYSVGAGVFDPVAGREPQRRKRCNGRSDGQDSASKSAQSMRISGYYVIMHTPPSRSCTQSGSL